MVCLASTLWICGSVSPSAARKVLSAIVKPIIVFCCLMGVVLCTAMGLLVSGNLTGTEVVRMFQVSGDILRALPLWISWGVAVGRSLQMSVAAYPVLGYVTVFLCGNIWGCLWRPHKESMGKIVGVIPGNAASLDSLAQLKDQIHKLTTTRGDEELQKVIGEMMRLHDEVLHVLGEVKENIVGCVSKNDLSEALQEVHQRIAFAEDVEEAPVVVALKKATGDLQKGVERLSQKVVRLNADVSAVNAALIESTDAVEAVQLKLSQPNTHTPSCDVVVEGNDSDADSSSDSSSTSSEDDADGFVQVLRAAPKEKGGKKVAKNRGIKFSPKLQQGMEDVDTIEALQEKLRAAREELKKEKEEKQKLSEAEKQLSRQQLEEKWANDRRTTRYGQREDRPLTPDEKGMKVSDLRRHLADEAQQAWVENQRRMGVELQPCESCGQLKKVNNSQHRCFRASWGGGVRNRGGIPQRQEVVVTATPGGVKIEKQTVVDTEVLEKNFKAMEAMKEKLDRLSARMNVDAVGATQNPTTSAVNYTHVVPGSTPQQIFPVVTGFPWAG